MFCKECTGARAWRTGCESAWQASQQLRSVAHLRISTRQHSGWRQGSAEEQSPLQWSGLGAMSWVEGEGLKPVQIFALRHLADTSFNATRTTRYDTAMGPSQQFTPVRLDYGAYSMSISVTGPRPTGRHVARCDAAPHDCQPINSGAENGLRAYYQLLYTAAHAYYNFVDSTS